MGALDIIIIVIIVLAAVYGAIKGFMHQIGTLTALVAGVLVCRFFGARVADAIVDAGAQYASAYRMMVYVLLFVLVFASIRFVAGLCGTLLSKMHVRVIDRIAGALFSVAAAVLTMSILVNVYLTLAPADRCRFENSNKPWRTAVLFCPTYYGIYHRLNMTENTDKEINAQAERPRANDELISKATSGEYKYGFVSDIDTDIIPAGLTEEIVRLISQKKGEPEWLLDFRLKAFRYWQTIEVPQWAHLDVPDIDFQAISYYAAPKKKEGPASMDEVDPALLDTFNRLGIPLEEQKVLSGMAVDAVMDSVSVKTTHRERLAELGIIFCSFSEAVREYPDLVRKYLGKVVSYRDNFYAALNSAVFSDGSFVYIPKGVRCPMELSTYFRINASGTGQFERTLIVADDDAYVSYLEGCTAPMRDENQLHAAIVEIIVEDRAEVKYSTVQNWYAGDAQGRGGVYNFVTKRGLCRGDYSKLSWTQVETGSAITWKYPSCILAGEGAVGEFYSVAVTNNYQQADTGTKMVHTGSNTRSTIVSKGISAGHSENSYRGLVKVARDAKGVRNYTQCDSLLLSDTCGAHTFPVVDVANPTAVVEHEATTSKISEQQIFYCNQRGIPTEEAVALIVNGYAKEVMNKLPMEFAVEAQKLLAITLEGSVG